MFSSLKIYLLAGLFLVIALMTWRINYLSNKADQLEAHVAELVSANQSNQTTIATQSAALKEWRDLAVTPEEAALAVRAHDALTAKILSLSEELRKVKESDRANPQCAALLASDLGAACPTITRRLRELSAPNPHRDR